MDALITAAEKNGESNLENKLPQEVKNMLDLFSSNPVYRSIIENNDVDSAVLELCYDTNFCKTTGINYNNIQKKDSRLIKIAILKYRSQN